MKIDITNQVKDEFLISLKTLISYPSVLNEGENGTPFGQAIQDVLEKTLEICRDIGFTTYLDPKGLLRICRNRSGSRASGHSLSFGCCSIR